MPGTCSSMSCGHLHALCWKPCQWACCRLSPSTCRNRVVRKQILLDCCAGGCILRYDYSANTCNTQHHNSMHKPEIDPVIVNLAKVIFGFRRSAGTKTFVVLDLPSCALLCLFLPLLILDHGKELLHFPIFGCLHNGCNKLLQETFVRSEP